MFRKYDIKRYDYISLIIIGCMITMSYFAIDSATKLTTAPGSLPLAQKQLFGFGVGLFLIAVLSFIDYHFIGKFAPLIYLLNIALLVAVLLLGEEVNGATRWLKISGIQLQPSELSKFLMIIVLAKYFDKFKDKINKPHIILGALALLAVPFFLISKEPDLSTALVLVFIFCLMIYVAGISYKYIVGIVLLLIPLTIGALWYVQQPDQALLKDYQMDRINALLHPDEYEKEEAMQTQNSVQAIGSGQLFGKGRYNGKLNKYNYLPEPQTDFIFSIIGEEFGFVGCAAVLAMIMALLLRVIYVGKDSKDMMGRLLVTGFVALIVFHTFINVGVTMAIVPNTGLPLPFVSYGLSSLWTNMLMLGMVINVSMQRKSNY